MLKRKKTMFVGEMGANDNDDSFLDENIRTESQRLRDVYKFEHFIILPDDVFKERWELLITCLLLFTAMVTPYRIAFFQTDDLAWTIVDYSTDVLFGIDIVVNFFSAFENANDELVHDRTLIAKSYLKSWFFIDIISILPVSAFIETTDYVSLARLARLPRLYRLIKMFKMSRLLKVIKERNTLSKYLSEVMKISVSFERLAFFVLMFIILAHITSCLWVIIASLEEEQYETWIARANLLDAEVHELYMAAFYYTIVIVTTIGYGDITVRTPIEQ